MVVFLPFTLKMCKVTGHNSSFALAWDKRAEEERGLEGLRKPPSSIHALWEQLICQHHYEPLISWPAPVFGGPGFWRTPPLLLLLPPDSTPPSILRSWGKGGQADPHSSRMIDRAAARRKGSCDEREKEKECVPCSLCAFNYLISCLPQPCQHNRVLTGAVSRQH